jgi:large subunit ribosomal protein L23
MIIYDVIKQPLISEKTAQAKESGNVITLKVHRDANKIEIKGAVEQLFKVEVTDVRTVNVRGKAKRVGRQMGKRSNWKKAYITLKQGSTVDFFEV